MNKPESIGLFNEEIKVKGSINNMNPVTSWISDMPSLKEKNNPAAKISATIIAKIFLII